MLSKDLRVLEALRAELDQKLSNRGGIPSNDEIQKELSRKDGKRRWQKLTEITKAPSVIDSRLLSGDDFDSRLRSYKTVISHVEKVWMDACNMYHSKNPAIAVFLSILVIEELGKLHMIWRELILYDVLSGPVKISPDDMNHRRKHFIGVMSGALINNRLERVLGKDIIRKILHQAESDELEKLRQGCLYIGVMNGETVTPGDLVDDKRARTFTILAGELMAEVLGFFPWDFDRMIRKVIEYERLIGMQDSKICLQ